MAYFPTVRRLSTFQAEWCDKCHHADGGCSVMTAHCVYDGSDRDSVLHILIPVVWEEYRNEGCTMFVAKDRVK